MAQAIQGRREEPGAIQHGELSQASAVLAYDLRQIHVLGPPCTPGLVQGSDSIAQLGSNGLAPAVTTAVDMVGR